MPGQNSGSQKSSGELPFKNSVEGGVEPFRESAPDCYCRLLPPSELPIDLDRYSDALTALGCAMVDDGSRVSEERPEILPDSGYTYFGQLIAHDLTKDVSSVDDVWRKEPEELQNLQTARLDLDVLYGGGPACSPELYENGGARLKLGESKNGASSFDICTSANGDRVLADDRSAANLILRQMTAVFGRLHNFAVEQFREEISDPTELFQTARRQIQRQFQWLVCEDYLRSILDPAVYKRIFIDRKPQIEWETFSIPVEFSVAAMRFGHAMVRPNYLFSFGHDMLLQNVLGRTSARGSISDEQKIEWGFFFRGAGPGRTVHSRPIDTRLSGALHQLPSDLIGAAQIACPHFRIAQNPSQLAIRTLLRGAGLRLASGQAVARAFGEDVLTAKELTRNCDGELTEQGRILREANFVNETPLWYYVLKESEVKHNGNRLGAVGSHIAAETIYAALDCDPDSYLHQNNGNHSPPIWEFPDGPRRIYGLSEFFRLAPLV